MGFAHTLAVGEAVASAAVRTPEAERHIHTEAEAGHSSLAGTALPEAVEGLRREEEAQRSPRTARQLEEAKSACRPQTGRKDWTSSRILIKHWRYLSISCSVSIQVYETTMKDNSKGSKRLHKQSKRSNKGSQHDGCGLALLRQ
jgi:hypothetical protein